MLDRWADSQLAAVPEVWRGRVRRGYRKKLDAAMAMPRGRGLIAKHEQAANHWLAGICERMGRLRLSPSLSNDELIAAAEKCAESAMALAEFAPGHFLTVPQLRARLNAYVDTFGIIPPAEKIQDRPAIVRMTDPLWWRRGLRVAQGRALEASGIALGYVHKNAEIYATTATVERRIQQKRRNAAMMADTIATNEDGQEYTLARLAELSVANPAIRRGELMTRIAGFESVAKGLGHIAEFVTLTCPSRFHRMRKVGGKVVANHKHDGSTPRDAQKYLTGLWARLRAKFARMGLGLYGFRIAEPHHDATPHWHMMLFMPAVLRAGAGAVGRFRAIFRRYALKDSGSEDGAKKYRCKFEAIDFSRGTAAGYLAKYISKNVDGGGYQVQGDIEGDMQAVTPAHRVEAWASTWGIRQFQQIGGAPVGVWRELRRSGAADDACAAYEDARSAADVGNWGRYTEVMGGAVCERDLRPLRIAREDAEKLNRYGEQAAPVVVGVAWRGMVQVVDGLCAYRAARSGVVRSRRYTWTIKRGGVGVLGLGAKRPRTSVNNCTRTETVPDENQPVFWQKWAFWRFDKPGETGAERETRESWEKLRVINGNNEAH